MTFFVACQEHVITATSLEKAEAHADMLNSNGRHDMRLCQHHHVGVEAPNGNMAKILAVKASQGRSVTS